MKVVRQQYIFICDGLKRTSKGYVHALTRRASIEKLAGLMDGVGPWL
ncbi:hypothetical protein [Terrimonas alba]